jgi:hypothetical protein
MAKEDYWDERVRSALAPALARGELRIVDELDQLFEELEAAFPVEGTKIDWDEVPGSLSGLSLGSTPEYFAQFFHEHQQTMGIDTPAYYLSDSALNFAIAGEVRALSQHLHIIIENPQHHYFVAKDFTWCMALTMEGNMNFGVRP